MDDEARAFWIGVAGMAVLFAVVLAACLVVLVIL